MPSTPNAIGRLTDARAVREVDGLTTTDELGRIVPVQPVRIVTQLAVADERGNMVDAVPVYTATGASAAGDRGQEAVLPVRVLPGLTAFDETGRVVPTMPVIVVRGGLGFASTSALALDYRNSRFWQRATNAQNAAGTRYDSPQAATEPELAPANALTSAASWAVVAGAVSVAVVNGEIELTNTNGAFFAVDLTLPNWTVGNGYKTTVTMRTNSGTAGATSVIQSGTSGGASDAISLTSTPTVFVVSGPATTATARVRVQTYSAVAGQKIIVSALSVKPLLSTFTAAGTAYEVGSDTFLGPELITNGGFASDLSGWTLTNGEGATQTHNAGRLRLASGAARGRSSQPFATVVGKTYRASVSRFPGTATITNHQVKIGTSAGTGTNYSGLVATEVLTFDFTATATTTFLTLQIEQADAFGEFDNVSVREIVPGRLGPELVANGGFDTAAGWTLGAGWSVAGGVASREFTGSTTPLTRSGILTVGRTYQVAVTINSISGNGSRAELGVAGATRTVPGTYTETIVAASADFRVSAFTNAVLEVDNVSVREVIPSLYGPFGPNVPAITNEGFVARQGFTNLLLQSSAFDDAAWGKVNATVTPNAVLAPDGTLTADTIAATTAAALYVREIVTTAAGPATTSIFAKAGTASVLQICEDHDGASTSFCNFDLVAGTVGSSVGLTGAIAAIGNGWFRCSVTFTAVAASAPSYFMPVPLPTSPRYPASPAGASIHLWGAQLVAAAEAGPYIPTTGGIAVRGEAQMGQNIFADGSALVDQDQLIFVRGTPKELAAASQNLLTLDNGTTQERLSIYISSSNVVTAFVRNAAGSIYNAAAAGALAVGAEVTGILRRMGDNWQAGKYANGALTWGAAAAGAFPSVLNKAVPGNRSAGGEPARSAIADARIVPGTFDTDAKVIAALLAQ